jgi:hypothetical protein
MSASHSPVSSGTASLVVNSEPLSNFFLLYQFACNSPETARASGVPQRLDSLYTSLRFPNENGTANTVIYSETTEAHQTNLGGGEALNPRKADLTRLLARIDGFQRLPVAWAGDDTVMVDSNTYDTAAQILQGLPYDVPLPQATPSADGEIGLTWIQQGGRFEVMIQPDRHVLWLMNQGHDYEPGGMIDLSTHKSLFDLSEALRRFWHG